VSDIVGSAHKPRTETAKPPSHWPRSGFRSGDSRGRWLFEQGSKIPYENGRAHAGDVANRGRADDLMVLLLAGRPNESRLEFDDHVAEGLHAQYLVDR
jgi:hypothetical protein